MSTRVASVEDRWDREAAKDRLRQRRRKLKAADSKGAEEEPTPTVQPLLSPSSSPDGEATVVPEHAEVVESLAEIRVVAKAQKPNKEAAAQQAQKAWASIHTFSDSDDSVGEIGNRGPVRNARKHRKQRPANSTRQPISTQPSQAPDRLESDQPSPNSSRADLSSPQPKSTLGCDPGEVDNPQTAEPSRIPSNPNRRDSANSKTTDVAESSDADTLDVVAEASTGPASGQAPAALRPSMAERVRIASRASGAQSSATNCHDATVSKPIVEASQDNESAGGSGAQKAVPASTTATINTGEAAASTAAASSSAVASSVAAASGGEDAEEDPPAKWAGWMRKRGHVFKTWRRRWFELERGVLQYCPKPGGKVKGTVHLRSGSLVKTSNKRANCFVISTGSYVLYCQPESAADRDRWMDWLYQHRDYAARVHRSTAR